MADLLLQKIIESFPREFFAGLSENHEWVYREAFESCFNDPLLDDESAKILVPHKRHALYETMLHKLALDCGCKSIKKPNIAQNYKYTEVTAGDISIVQNHVNYNIKNLHWSHFREQGAYVNEIAGQVLMEFVKDKSQPKSFNFFGLLLHSSHYKEPSKPGFLKFVIPDPESKGFLGEYNVGEVLEQYPQPPSKREKNFTHLVKWKKQLEKRKLAS